MNLPDNAVGVTDSIKYLECPRRFAHGMKRHELKRDLGEDGEVDVYPATVYGTAFHDAVELVENEQMTDEQAVGVVIGRYGRWLDPEDRTRLLKDLATYHRRDPKGVELILAEGEIRVPLGVHKGKQVWFRGRVDRLYRRLNSNVYIHRDYKTSKWPKSEQEVHNDKQMWAYNTMIYEWIEQEFLIPPDALQQVYDQLRFGEVSTSKNDEQRAEMKAWLFDVAVAILEDNEFPHRYNQWCPYCPILVGCPVLEELSDYALSRIAVLAPTKPKLKKNGQPGKQTITELDPSFFDEAVAELPKIKDALKILKKADELITGELKGMPDEDRHAYGYGLKPEDRTYWPVESTAVIVDELRDRVPSLVTVTKTAVERELESDHPEEFEWVMSLAEQKEIEPKLVKLA